MGSGYSIGGIGCGIGAGILVVLFVILLGVLVIELGG